MTLTAWRPTRQSTAAVRTTRLVIAVLGSFDVGCFKNRQLVSASGCHGDVSGYLRIHCCHLIRRTEVSSLEE
eukprot:m.993513 g.993513  ORF g.993513 m.993513 type:complete len:72 (-) comp24012_c0_seq3:55-270(-)